MSDPPLPADVLDHIADHLHDKPETLKQCCLASKSWIPRTRKHLFADIKLDTTRDLRSWKRTFPNLSTSPARYAKTPSVGRPEVIRDVDAEVGGWITGFSCVEHLDLGAYEPDWGFDQPAVPFVPFHGFSPVMKSLHVATISLPPRRLSTSSFHSPFSRTWLWQLTTGYRTTPAMVPKGTRC